MAATGEADCGQYVVVIQVSHGGHGGHVGHVSHGLVALDEPGCGSGRRARNRIVQTKNA